MVKKQSEVKNSKGDENKKKETLSVIGESKDSSKCAHGSGQACSVEEVKLELSSKPHEQLDLSKDDLMKALRNMYLSRFSDNKHLNLIKQGKSHFHIGGSGHEAVQTAIGFSLKPKYDWGWTYYRDLAYMYSLGYKPEEYFMLAFAKPEDPASGGRQMPNHYGHLELNQPSQSSPTGTQFLNAVGTALANRKNRTDEVTYVAAGEGTTSQGEFYEAVNWASREKLPVMFHIQDNGYAISVPREKQSMGSDVGHSFCCYSNLKMFTFDGTNYFDSLKAAREAIQYIRSGKGPVLMHSLVERLLPHSSSDDHRKYRDKDELEKMAKQKDCIAILQNYMIDNGMAKQKEFDELTGEIKKEIDDAADSAWEKPDAKPENATDHNYAPEETRDLKYSDESDLPSEGKCVLVDAVNHALHEEMAHNDKMLIFGEDIEDPKGGVFTSTRGLTDKFGSERVFNSPLAEASILGVAVGLAVRGYKPVVEIQFGDYIWPAFHQFRNELATMRFRSNGAFSSPVVVRVAVGGYIHGGLCHSQNIEAFFSHIPGLYIAYPSTSADAKGLLKTACRIEDPVLFLEHKGMYRLPYASTPEPDENYLLPFGKGKIVKEGSDATIVTWAMGCRDSLNAAKKLEKEGKSIEIIDLRTIVPWDRELVLESIAKTNRALIVHEDTETMGFGAEIAATITNSAFRDLDAPVMRLAAKDSHIPYSPVYEKEVLPNEHKIYDKLKELLEF